VTIQDVQVAAADFAKRAGRRPIAIKSNQATHDELVKQLQGKNPGFKMGKWQIDDALASGQLEFL